MNNYDQTIQAGNAVSSFNNPLNTTDQPKKGGIFGGILRTVGSAAASMIPGVGGIISGMIGGLGKGPDFGSMQQMVRESANMQMRMIGIQHQVSNQSTEFSAVTNLLKSRHDSEMAAVNNLKS